MENLLSEMMTHFLVREDQPIWVSLMDVQINAIESSAALFVDTELCWDYCDKAGQLDLTFPIYHLLSDTTHLSKDSSKTRVRLDNKRKARKAGKEYERCRHIEGCSGTHFMWDDAPRDVDEWKNRRGVESHIDTSIDTDEVLDYVSCYYETRSVEEIRDWAHKKMWDGSDACDEFERDWESMLWRVFVMQRELKHIEKIQLELRDVSSSLDQVDMQCFNDSRVRSVVGEEFVKSKRIFKREVEIFLECDDRMLTCQRVTDEFEQLYQECDRIVYVEDPTFKDTTGTCTAAIMSALSSQLRRMLAALPKAV